MKRPTAPSLDSLEPIAIEQRGLARLERTFEVITPIFGGGVHVDQDERQRQLKRPDPVTPIRTAGIRGQLRFWWRATSSFGSLKDLREAEDKLWGAASSPGKVALSLLGKQPKVNSIQVFEMRQSPNGNWNPRPLQEMGELAYGAFPLQPKASQREQWTPGVLHELRGAMTLRLEAPAQHRDELERTLDAWLAFGGVGGRTRRGFGAVAECSVSKSPEALLQELKKTSRALDGVPSLASAELVVVDEKKTAMEVLKSGIGKLQAMRQGKDKGRNLGQQSNRPGRSRWPEAEQIRDLTKMSALQHSQKLVNVNSFPRAAFGMPIIFHFKDKDDPQKKGEIDPTLVPQGKERRASPLIIRPYRKSNGKYGCLALVLTDESRLREPLTLKDWNREHNVRHRLNKAEASWPKSPLEGEPDVLRAFLGFFKK